MCTTPLTYNQKYFTRYIILEMSDLQLFHLTSLVWKKMEMIGVAIVQPDIHNVAEHFGE